MSHKLAHRTTTRISRRSALRAGVAASAAVTVATAGPKAVVAQGTEHLEVHVVVANPVNITLAGGGPPQRGDFFYIDGPIYAADDTAAPYQRLTTVQFLLDDGSIMGLINEGGSDPDIKVGAVQGGTGRFTGALGTFQQFIEQGTTPGVATPDAAATPAPAGTVVRSVFDLILPAQG